MLTALTARISAGRSGRWHANELTLAFLALVVATVIAMLPVSAAVVLVAGGSFALFSFLNPLAGLCLLALAVPFGAVEVSVGGLGISAVELLAAVLLVAWVARLAARRERAVFVSWGILPTVLFAGLLLVGATFTPVETLALKEVLRWLELVAVALVAHNVLRERRQLVVIVVCLVVAGALEGLVGAGQFLMGFGPPSFAVGPFVRAYGTFSQPNPFAGYLGMVWPLAASLAIFYLIGQRGHSRGSSGPLPLLATISTAIMGAAMLMSLSRGAWLGAALAVLVLAGLLQRRLLSSLPALAMVAITTVLAQQLDLLPATIGARISDSLSFFRVFDASTVQVTPQNWAVVERMASWQAAWRMFQENPIFGIGPGQYVAAYSRFALPAWPQALGHAHNFYLNVLAETGLAGIASYLLVLVGWFGAGVHTLRVSLGPQLSLERAVACGVIAALSASALHNFFDNLYVHGMNAHVGLLLGVLFAAGRIWRGGQSSSIQTNGRGAPRGMASA